MSDFAIYDRSADATRDDGPPLRPMQSLWAMEDLPTATAPWTLDQQIAQLCDAGYGAVAVDMGARRAPLAPQLAAVLAGVPLDRAVFTFAGDEAALDDALRYAEIIGAHELVLCASVYEQNVSRAARLIESFYDRAASAGVELHLETHRNTLTNDLRFTRRLVDELDERVGLAIDLSHYIVGAEIPSDPTDEIEEQIAAIIARTASVQGRIATRCQVQIPLDHPSSPPWISLARRWWRDAFAALLRLRSAAEVSAPITFVTELGTTPYAMTDSAGVELSDRWAEARQLIAWAKEDLAAARHAVLQSPG